MTSKTSFFNKGIYISTVKRYIWGAVLYFIMLLAITVLPVVLSLDTESTYRTITSTGKSILYNSDMLVPSVLIAMAVSVVVGLLVFRFVHSKKSSIFTHSLPVSRISVYLSSLAASFTLMMVPVLLNTVCLLLMALTEYAAFISVGSCFVWMGLNLLTLFLMFSAMAFVSMLTGNSFAVVGLSVLFHFIPTVITAAMSVVADCFLYGFSADNAMIEKVFTNNFVVWIISSTESIFRNKVLHIGIPRMLLYIAIALVFYVLAGILYTKRNLETAEDVAGFKCLNPIFKYLITFVGALGAFAVFSSFIAEKAFVFWLAVIVVSAIAYFAAEMVLRKTLRVWRSYKGYLGFSVCFAALMAVFAFTGFFGFETYVPAAEEVESVAVYNYYNTPEEPHTEDAAVIEHVTAVHQSFVEPNQIYLMRPDLNGERYYTRMHLKYKLKNGREVARAYWVSAGKKYEILDGLYEYESYKRVMEAPLSYNTFDISRISCYSGRGAGNITISGQAEMEGLLACLQKDIGQLSYSEMYHNDNSSSAHIDIEYIRMDEITGKRDRIDYFNYQINRNFKHTIRWFRDNGYADFMEIDKEKPLYIAYDFNFSTEPNWITNYANELSAPEFSKEGFTRIQDTGMKEKLIRYFDEAYISFSPDTAYYYVFYLENNGCEILGLISEEDAPKVASSLFD